MCAYVLTVSPEVVAQIVAGLHAGNRPVTVTLPDGSEVSAKMEIDVDSDLSNDGDWFGEVQSCRYGDPRPKGFDGNAEKLTARNCQVWWQPPTDVERGTDSFKSLRDRVAGYYLEHWYYVGIVVERTSYCASDKRYTRETSASLWGIESDANADYLTEVVTDLLHQLDD
jgi:hypothetical protein